MLLVSISALYMLGLTSAAITTITAVSPLPTLVATTTAVPLPTLTFAYGHTYRVPAANGAGDVVGNLDRTSVHIHCHLKDYPQNNILRRLLPNSPTGRNKIANRANTCKNINVNYVSLRYLAPQYRIVSGSAPPGSIGYCAAEHARSRLGDMYQETRGGVQRLGLARTPDVINPPPPPVTTPPTEQLVGYNALTELLSVTNPIFANGYDLRTCDEYPFASTHEGGGPGLGVQHTQMCVSEDESHIQSYLIGQFYATHCGADEQKFAVEVAGVTDAMCAGHNIVPATAPLP